jgi:hypothetical protein
MNLSDSLDVGGYGHAQATAIAGVGWAVLDLADAIRETRQPVDMAARMMARRPRPTARPQPNRTEGDPT